MKHEGAIRVIMCEFPPGIEVLQVTRKTINHKLLSFRCLHLIFKELDSNGTGNNFSLIDDPTDGIAELRARPILLIT